MYGTEVSEEKIETVRKKKSSLLFKTICVTKCEQRRECATFRGAWEAKKYGKTLLQQYFQWRLRRNIFVTIVGFRVQLICWQFLTIDL